MRKTSPLLAALALITACAPYEESDLDANDVAELGRAEEALLLAAKPVELPTDELPHCWWAESDDSCVELCADEEAGPVLRARVLSSSRPPAPSKPARASATTRAVRSGTMAPVSVGAADTIAAPDDDECFTPDGVLPCPHCTTTLDGQTRIGNFWVNNAVGTHVVIANGLGKYRIARYPALDASLYSMAGEPEIPNAHNVVLDLLHGGEELDATDSLPSAGQDLYLWFTYTGQLGELPASTWMRCPADGSACVPFL